MIFVEIHVKLLITNRLNLRQNLRSWIGKWKLAFINLKLISG